MNNFNTNLGISCTLLEWYNKHKSCHRIRRLLFTGEITLEGKIYYVVLVCMDCSCVYVLDRLEVKDEK